MGRCRKVLYVTKPTDADIEYTNRVGGSVVQVQEEGGSDVRLPASCEYRAEVGFVEMVFLEGGGEGRGG